MKQKWQYLDQAIWLGGIEYIGRLIRLKSDWIVRKPMMTADNVTCHNVLGLGMDMVQVSVPMRSYSILTILIMVLFCIVTL